MKETICFLCKKEFATSRDHIPPKSLFPSSKRNDLLTAPSCIQCNNSYSADEERFRADILMLAGPLQAGDVWESFKSGLKRSPAIKEELFGSMHTVGNDTLIRVPQKRTERVLIKIARGLSYHFTKEYSKDDYETLAFLNPQEAVLDIMNRAQIRGGVSDNNFLYWGAVASDNSQCSIWWMLFYKRAFAVVSFSPPAD